ncbi:MAG: class I SAM-dependent methyltransferase [Acidimicrobiia bacterium]
MGSSSEYVFGDTDAAARRLDVVAEYWASPSTKFLREDVPSGPRLALDLGCGPGYTTRLVAAETGAMRTVGLDTSDAFLDRARTGAPAGVEFVHHDVMELPLPSAPADLLYCRLLLSHIPRPDRVVRAWMSQLAPGGVLALDEVAWISTSEPVLSRYLEILEDLLAVRGSALAAGPVVDGLDAGSDARKRSSLERTHPVPAAVAAEMFTLNLVTWREEPYVRDAHRIEELDDLDAQLREITRRPGRATITWGMRQVTFERTG